MIKINLLSEQKVKRTHDRGREILGLGMLALVATGALVFVFVHRPLAEDLEVTKAANQDLERENRELEAATKDFEEIQDALEALAAREAAVESLNEAKATPAWLMNELSRILTPDVRPTMDEASAARAAQNIGRVWNDAWDPKRAWIIEFSERDGSFTLHGGANADADMTQLALRLEASAYFDDVVPQGGDTAEDRESGVSYHEFTITGEVRY